MATSLEASLKLRDQFTSVLKKIDGGLKSTAQSMGSFKQKVSGPARAMQQFGQKVQSVMSKVNNSIKSGMSSASNVVQSSTTRILSIFGNFGNRISSVFSSAFNGIKSKFSSIATVMGSAMSSAKSRVVSGFSAATSAVKNGVSRIGGFLKQSGNAFKQYGNDVKNSLDKMKSSATSATSGFKSMVAAIGVTKAIGTAINVVKGSVEGAVERFDTLNQFPKMMQAVGFSADQAANAKNKLVEGIDGLPTTLGEVVSTTQRIATMTKDLDGATKTTLALNNAFLASGSDSNKAAQGLEQYIQMLGKGKVDMQSWRSLQDTMGVALNEVAESFGFAGRSAQNDLYKALQDGNITFDQFNNRIIKMSEATGGFAERALIGSEGIKTSFKNIKTAVTNGVEGSIRKIDSLVEKMTGKNIAQNLNGLKQKVKDVFGFINGVDGKAGLLDKLPGMIQKVMPYVNALKDGFKRMGEPIGQAVDAVRKSLSKLTGGFGSKESVGGFQGFVDSIVDGVSKLAKFVEKNSDSIAKFITMLPKIAAAVVGFKIGKSALTPLLNFSSGLFGILKATGKLGGGLGKAFFGMFKKMPSSKPGKGVENALQPVTSFTDSLKSFAKTAGKLAVVFVVIKLVEQAAEAIKQLNDKVPSDMGDFSKKLANLGLALAGMGLFVRQVGKFAEKNPKVAIAGLTMTAAISGELMLTAEAIKQIGNKVPNDIKGFAKKIANMGIALEGMASLVGITGRIVTKNPTAAIAGLAFLALVSAELILAAEAMSQINAKAPSNMGDFASKMANIGIALGGLSILVGVAGLLVAADPIAAISGLAFVALIALELMLAAEAIQQINEKVPSDIGDFASKMANMGIAIGGFSLLAIVIGAFVASGVGALVLGGGLLAVAAVALDLMLVAEAMQQLDQKVPEDMSSVNTKIDGMVQVIQKFSSSNLGSIMGVFNNLVGLINTAVVSAVIQQFVDLSTELEKLMEVEVPDGVKEKINEFEEVIKSLDGTSFEELLDHLVQAVDLMVVNESLQELVDISNQFKVLEGVKFDKTKVETAVTDIQEMIDFLSNGQGNIFSKIADIFGKSLDIGVFATANEAFSQLVQIGNSLVTLEGTEFDKTVVEEKVKAINRIIELLGTSNLVELVGTMIKKAQLTEVKDALDEMYLLVEPINKIAGETVEGLKAAVSIGMIKGIIEQIGTANLIEYFGTMIKAAQLTEVKESLDTLYELIEPINKLAENPIDAGASAAITNIKKVVAQLSNFPQTVGIEGLQAIKSTFDELNNGLGNFVSNTQTNLSGLTSTASVFTATMNAMKLVVVVTMVSITQSATVGMQQFIAAIAKGMVMASAKIVTGGAMMASSARSIYGQMFSAGSYVMQGLASGIQAGSGSAVAAAKSVADQVASTVRKALDIHSPSRVMIGIGEFVTQGLAKGILAAQNLVANASQMIARAAVPEELGSLSASGNISSNVYLDDDEISRLSASASQTVVVENKQVVPQVTLIVETKDGQPIDEEGLLQRLENKVIELMDSDMS
ncbi:tape measure protein [Listeria monocytogenes]